MHEDDELTLNSDLEKARYYVFLNLEISLFLVVWSDLYRVLNEHVQFFKYENLVF